MKTSPQLPKIAIAASMLLSLLIFSLSFFYVRYLAQQRFELEVSKVRQAFLESSTAANMLGLNMQNLVHVTPDLKHESFQSFMEGIMLNYNFVRSANLYRKILHQDRAAHEKWLKDKDSESGLVETNPEDADGTIPAVPAPHYLSLVAADIQTAANTVYGWNVKTDPLRREAINHAIATGKPSASDGFLLDDGHASVEVFVPFFKQGRIPGSPEENEADLAGVIGMTVDMPLLIGNEEWRRNLTVILSTSLSNSTEMRDLFRSLDKEPGGIFGLGTLDSHVDLSTFGQELRLRFTKDLYVSRLNYGILLLVLSGCLGMTFLIHRLAKTLVRLAKSLSDLAQLNAGLEQKVADRTRALAESKAEIQEILDNLDDGIVLVDAAMKIQPRYSPAAPRILGQPELAGVSIQDILFGQLDKLQEDVARHRFTFPMLFGADDFQWGISHDNLLTTMKFHKALQSDELDTRILSLRYAPLYNQSGCIHLILLVISDITEVMALRKSVEDAKVHADQKMQMLMEILQADRNALQSFMSETKSRLEALSELMKKLKTRADSALLQAIFREVHTFKGNARMIKLLSISRQAHQLEEQYAESALQKTALPEETRLGLWRELQALTDLTQKYLQSYQDIFANQATPDQSMALRQELIPLLKAEIPNKGLCQLLESQLRQETFSFMELWRSYEPMVQEISSSLGKQVKALSNVSQLHLLKELQAPLKDALTHLIRNALDHGIETPEQRQAAGKKPIAELTVTARSEDQQILIDIADDGSGVNCDKVWKLAHDRGFVSQSAIRPSDQEILEILFHPGFSTKSEATDISGRGVGLDAVRSFMSAHACQVEISSKFGSGTRFRLRIPLSKTFCLLDEQGKFQSWVGQNLSIAS